MCNHGLTSTGWRLQSLNDLKVFNAFLLNGLNDRGPDLKCTSVNSLVCKVYAKCDKRAKLCRSQASLLTYDESGTCTFCLLEFVCRIQCPGG